MLSLISSIFTVDVLLIDFLMSVMYISLEIFRTFPFLLWKNGPQIIGHYDDCNSKLTWRYLRSTFIIVHGIHHIISIKNELMRYSTFNILVKENTEKRYISVLKN